MKIKKAIIPAAGLGTRFLPATKATPKEMLPVLNKPAIQYVIEEGVKSKIENFVIVTGRSKKSIEDHFNLSPDRLSERQLRDYLIHLRDVRAVAKGTFQQHFFGIKFLFVNTLGLDWALLTKKKSVCPIANDFPTCEATSTAAA